MFGNIHGYLEVATFDNIPNVATFGGIQKWPHIGTPNVATFGGVQK